MALTTGAVQKLITAAADLKLGNQLADAVVLAAGATHSLVGAIVATNVSQTVDFGVLAVGDVVVHIPAVAGNSKFVVCATAGDLGTAAVVGDLYLVVRAKAAASDVKY